MANTNLARLQAIKSAMLDLLLMTTQVISNPTQGAVDKLITAVNGGTNTNPYNMRPDYSLDGESYQWNAYADSLTDRIDKVNKLIQAESQPWIVRSRARP